MLDQTKFSMDERQVEMADKLYDLFTSAVNEIRPNSAEEERKAFIAMVSPWITWDGAPNAPNGSGQPTLEEIADMIDDVLEMLAPLAAKAQAAVDRRAAP